MVVKEINNSNYEAFTNLDLVAFSYAYEGAMGEGGGIYMIDASGQVYHANYYYGDLQEEHVKDILPMTESHDTYDDGISDDAKADVVLEDEE